MLITVLGIFALIAGSILAFYPRWRPHDYVDDRGWPRYQSNQERRKSVSARPRASGNPRNSGNFRPTPPDRTDVQ